MRQQLVEGERRPNAVAVGCVDRGVGLGEFANPLAAAATACAQLVAIADREHSGDLALTVRQRVLSAIGLPVLGFAMTALSFDLLMSLDLRWASTIFGLHFICSALCGAMSVAILTLCAMKRAGTLPGITVIHFYNLGKLLLTSVSLWAYIVFCEYMLVWVADLPAETHWFVVRSHGPWAAVSLALVFGHFVLPFLALLSAELKKRPALLGGVAAFILAMHLLEVHWLVLARFGSIARIAAGILAITGVSALMIAWFLWRMRGASALPLRDPYLRESMEPHS